jgi:hypothetical protein
VRTKSLYCAASGSEPAVGKSLQQVTNQVSLKTKSSLILAAFSIEPKSETSMFLPIAALNSN